MAKSIVSGLLSILILASISSIAYTELASPLQQIYATPPVMPPLPLPDIVLDGSPTVGKTGELVMTFVYDSSGWIFEDPIIEMSISGGDGLYRITDIVSNVHTGDPNVFAPYDYKTQSQLAIFDYPYVVKGTVEILKEGFHKFSGVGLDGIFDVHVTFAIDRDRHMPYSMYISDGYTFLDHTRPASGVSDEPPPPLAPLSAPKADSVDLTYQEMISELEDYVASVYQKERFSHKVLLDELLNIHLTPPQIREFLENKVDFSEDEIRDLVDMIPDGYLETMDEEIATGQAGNLTSFNVSGRVVAPQYYLKNGTVNIHGIEVCALDYDDLIEGFAELHDTNNETACDYTSQFGLYHIRDIINHDPNDRRNSYTNVDLVIRVTSRGDSGLIVQNTTRQPYVQYSVHIADFNETNTITNIQLIDGVGGAGRIIDTISDGREFFEAYRISPQTLTVYWQHDAGSSAFDDNDNNGAFYRRSTDTVYLDGAINNTASKDDSFGRRVILHEFGHYVIDIAGVAGGYCEVSPHYLARVSGIQCAWTEGWADFVPHFVDDSARLLSYQFLSSDGELVDYHVDLEEERIIYSEPYGYIPINRQDDNRMNAGHLIEGQVAAALWDIKDIPNNSTFDRVGGLFYDYILDDQALGDDEIMGIFNSARYFTFEEFYNAWNDQSNPSIQNIMQLHAMAFATNTDPIVLTDAGTGIITLNTISGQVNMSSLLLPINEENLRAIIQADANSISDADLYDIVIDNIVQTNLDSPNSLLGAEQQFRLGDYITYNITDPSYRQADTYSLRVGFNNINNTRSGTGDMTIMLQDPLACDAQISIYNIDYGQLANGESSSDLSFITITNTGIQAILPKLSATHWVSSADPNVIVMDAQQTRWSLTSLAVVPYSDKTPFSFNVTQNMDVSIPSSDFIYLDLQVLVDLIDDTHEGPITQDVTVSSTCE